VATAEADILKDARDFRVKSTPSVLPKRLAHLGKLHQQSSTRLNLGSTLLRVNQACSGLLIIKILLPQATPDGNRNASGTDAQLYFYSLS
jgi:hypothetical protein